MEQLAMKTTTENLPVTLKARRSTVNGIDQTVTCYRADGSSYQVPSYYPARGESLESAARALGVRLVTRRDATAESEGLVVCEIHNLGESGVLAVSAAINIRYRSAEQKPLILNGDDAIQALIDDKESK